MFIELEKIKFDDFKSEIENMPTPWLLNYYRMLNSDNEEYNTQIDIVIDLEGGTTDDVVFDKQVECFNMMLVIIGELHNRNVRVPSFRVMEY